jgi:hypothetical protein
MVIEITTIPMLKLNSSLYLSKPHAISCDFTMYKK